MGCRRGIVPRARSAMAGRRHKPAITRTFPLDRRGVHHSANFAGPSTVSWLAPGLWPDVGHEPRLLAVHARVRECVGGSGSGASDRTFLSGAGGKTMAVEAGSRRGRDRLLFWKPYSVVRLDPTGTAPPACCSVSPAASADCAGPSGDRGLGRPGVPCPRFCTAITREPAGGHPGVAGRAYRLCDGLSLVRTRCPGIRSQACRAVLARNCLGSRMGSIGFHIVLLVVVARGLE